MKPHHVLKPGIGRYAYGRKPYSLPTCFCERTKQMNSNSVQDVFKHNRARKNVIFGGAVILICITALSCVSSFMIFREGFRDVPYIFQQALALFAVVVIEGTFVWLVYGFT